jgi:hypothetical protein
MTPLETLEAYKRDWTTIRDWINKNPLENAKFLLANFDDRFNALLDYNDARIDSPTPLTPDEATTQTIKDMLCWIKKIDSGQLEVIYFD